MNVAVTVGNYTAHKGTHSIPSACRSPGATFNIQRSRDQYLVSVYDHISPEMWTVPYFKGCGLYDAQVGLRKKNFYDLQPSVTSQHIYPEEELDA
ncbi:hypothetical protein RUM43_009344 [Polyplax serrata]|uniref:Uncharacterized protein n=1 Tax=Polyplax serrata TaxID=468196 RepID=A0AAN8S8H5_POLSC